MTELPTGTVTFLFSDIEGSTRLLRFLGERYREVLDRHASIIRAAIATAQGHEVRTEGDSFFVAFRSPVDAVAAAVAAQRGLAEYQWPEGGRVRVRIGLHTGEGVVGGDDYIGIDVNRAARIMAAGHGGQVLLSDTSRSLVADALPEGVRTRSLGLYRLKDLPVAEVLHQLDIGGLQARFPPLRALDVRATHLPREATTFVGRSAELECIAEHVAERRLVTLIGPGGCGKTRLALRAAAAIIDSFADGGYFVGLASIRDVKLLPAAIATALNLSDCGTSPLEPCGATLGCSSISSCESILKEWLGDREVLLVLDNLEQIEAAGRVIDELLSAGSGLRVLATSRAPLRVPGEQEFPVRPFTVPVAGAHPRILERSEAVRLFVDRAQLIDPTFRPTPSDVAVVADICRALDGLPLAIELAAARTRVLPLGTIRTRLGRRLDAFVATSAAPLRHHSLRETIAWSHDLLDDAGKALFRRLAVFAGGWTVEAADAVCAGPPIVDVETALEELAEQSLVQASRTGGGPRSTVLESIGEFAAEQLETSGEALETRAKHAAFFRQLVEASLRHTHGPERKRGFDQLEADLDNLRVAIHRSVRDGRPDDALTIAAGMSPFWIHRNHGAEGLRILVTLIEADAARTNPAFPDAARAAALIARRLGDNATVRRIQGLSPAAGRRLKHA